MKIIKRISTRMNPQLKINKSQWKLMMRSLLSHNPGKIEREKQSLETTTVSKKKHSQFSLQNKKTDTGRSQGLPNVALCRSSVIGLRRRPGSSRVERFFPFFDVSLENEDLK